MLKFDNFRFNIPSSSRELVLDASIELGTVVFVAGESGCGKSSFLNTISGVLESVGGGLFFKGKNLKTVSLQDRDIGYVFQDYRLFAGKTVFENLLYPLNVNKKFKGLSKSQKAERADECLKKAKLTHLKKKFDSELSGGERQRVAILWSLIYLPSILLLDEPFSALDAHSRHLFTEIIREYVSLHSPVVMWVSHSSELPTFDCTKKLIWGEKKLSLI